MIRRGKNYLAKLPLPGAVMLAGFMLAAGKVDAQQFTWPEEPENLQVLGEDIKGARLGAVMRNFATSLGVRCSHCHVGEGQDLVNYDFAADDKPAKLKARVMLEMVESLNGEYLSRLSTIEARAEPNLNVECITCHRRQSRPAMLDDMLFEITATDGIDAAIEEYKALREQFYGGFSYDFSAGMLTGLGEQLGSSGDYDPAIRFLQLEIEVSGASPGVYYTLGGVQVKAGLVDDAVTSFTEGLAIAPDGWKPFFQTELDNLAERAE